MLIQRISAVLVIHHRRFMPVLVIAAVIFMACFPNPVQADWAITQTIPLKAGWNAVFLEVNPANASPDAVFNGIPVEKVLAYFPKTSSVQYIQEPTETSWNQTQWHFWIPSAKPEYVLRNLFALQANQTYLIKCTQDYQWQITGEPQFNPFRWQTNSFNLTGFRINESSQITFEQYFNNISAFTGTTIYSLMNGIWAQSKLIDTIKYSQAYWVYCNGATNFVGPISVWLPSPGNTLWFTQATPELEIKITNQLSIPLTFTIETVPTTVGDSAVPLSTVTASGAEEKVYTPFTSYTSQNPLEAGKTQTIRFAVRRGEITAAQVKSLLKVTGALGDRIFIPVVADKM